MVLAGYNALWCAPRSIVIQRIIVSKEEKMITDEHVQSTWIETTEPVMDGHGHRRLVCICSVGDHVLSSRS